MSIQILAVAMLLGTDPMAMGSAPSPLLVTGPSESGQNSGNQAAPAITPASAPEPASQNADQVAPPPTPTKPAAPPDIVVFAREPDPGDPMAATNAKSFAVTQKVDAAFVAPAALAYKQTLPKSVRSGLRNVLKNLHEPVVFLNYLVQLKPGKAAETLGRFAINSTVGVAGLVDVAKKRPFNLPRRPNGFADTLGYYGVKPGPFMYLPLIGPTTVRDLAGGLVDRLVLPLGVGKPFNRLAWTIPTGVVAALDHRAEFDEQLHQLHDDTADPYTASRDFYLRRRQAEIDALHSKPHRKPMPEALPEGSDAVPAAPKDSSTGN